MKQQTSKEVWEAENRRRNRKAWGWAIVLGTVGIAALLLILSSTFGNGFPGGVATAPAGASPCTPNCKEAVIVQHYQDVVNLETLQYLYALHFNSASAGIAFGAAVECNNLGYTYYPLNGLCRGWDTTTNSLNAEKWYAACCGDGNVSVWDEPYLDFNTWYLIHP